MTNAYFWPEVGNILLVLAMGTTIFTWFAALTAFIKKDSYWTQSAIRSLITVFFILLGCMAVLWTCLLTDNFLVEYVYGYSSKDMPILYKFTALWGGQDGSLLLWVFMTALYSAAAVFWHRKSDLTLLPGVILTLSSTIGFFLILLLYSDNPFSLFPEAPVDGRGLNPLLQNPSMAIHPPSLYLGYTGMVVPFAFAISALLNNQLDIRWILASRIWTLLAWFFLSLGNLLGAQWAYVELGWGGFWGWDPVENAALLPWLTATAFLHSVMIQERRGLLKTWNMVLITLSFLLTILGTYLTRSGVVQSVHSFARSSIGIYFIVFLIIAGLIATFLIVKRRKELAGDNIFESFLSKESAFVLNNMVLVGSAFIILWSTLFPSMSELLIGKRVLVGPPFFNKMLAPFGIALLLLTGIGPMIGWKKATKENLKTSFILPTIIGTVAAILIYFLNFKEWYTVLSAFSIVFVLVTLVMEFKKGLEARQISYGESWTVGLLKLFIKNNRKYGGYIVHLGILFIFAGIAGAAYKEIFDFTLKPGESASFKNYSITLQNFDQQESAHVVETFANISLFEKKNFLAEVKPARFYYKNPGQPSTEVDIHSTIKEDVYFTLGAIHPEDSTAQIRVTLNPLVGFLWFGGLLLIVGGLISLLPSLARGGRRA